MNSHRSSWRTLVVTFWPDLRRHWRQVALAYGFRSVAVGASLVAPWALKIIIDHLVTGTPPPSLAAATRAYGLETMVVALTLGCLAVTIGGAVAGSAEKNLSARTRERLTAEVRDRVIAHLLTLSAGLRTRHRSGELVLRIVDDTDLFVRVLTKTLPQIFQHALTLAATLAAMWWLETRVALAGLIWLPVVTVLVRHDGRRLWRASREKRTREGEVSALAQEIVRGMAVIQASGTEASAEHAFARVNERRVSAGRQETRVAVSLERNLQIVQGVALAAVTGLGALLVLQGRMSLGDLTLVTIYTGQLLKPVEKLNDLAETTGRGIAGGERLVALLDQQAAVPDHAGAANIARSSGILDCRGVWFNYPDRPHPVLAGVDLHVEPGTLAVIVGPSGAGKSTLFGLLLRLADPTGGDILLDGRSIRDIRLRALRAQFAVLSQDTHVFAGTIREAIAPEGHRSGDPALWQALALVSLASFVRQLPNQLDTVLGEDALNLSGGQRRRIALARAFLLDRPILLLDEPLANIDTESASVILDALDMLRTTRTCIATTHDPALVERADVVYRLEGGRLVAVAAAPRRRAGMAVAR